MEPKQARRFTEFIYNAPRVAPVNYPLGKLAMRQAAEAAGLRVPKLIDQFDHPREIDLDKLPDRCALKLDHLSSRRGVFLLRRYEAGYLDIRYRDLLRQRDFTRDEIVEAMRLAAEEEGKSSDRPVIVEEMVVGENGPNQIPYDYKLYTFGDGVAECIVQIDRNVPRTRLAFFDRNFDPLEPNCVVYVEDAAQLGPHVRPANWRQLLDVARIAIRAIDVPFISVDTYTTGTDVIVGELTKGPGGPYFGMWQFSDEFDAELGAYYRLAMLERGLPIPMVTKRPKVLWMAGKRAAAAQRKAATLGVFASARQLARAVRRSIARRLKVPSQRER